MAGRITSGRVTVKRVEAKALAKVEVVRLPIHRTTKRNQGIKITIDPANLSTVFEIFVVVEESDRGRARLGLGGVPDGVQVSEAVFVEVSR